MRYERTSPVRHPGRIAAVVILLAVIAGVVLLQKGVFVLRNVWVEGDTRFSNEQVVDYAGLHYGQSMFSLDRETITANVQRNRFLILDSIYIDYPDALILRVRERKPLVALTWMGWLVMLDELGCVMELSGQLDTRLEIPVVTGMDVTAADVGNRVGTRTPAQYDAMEVVVKELESQAVTARVAELNVASLDNLYLVTQEGMKVELGDSTDIEIKIGMMRSTLEELAIQGLYTGLLDVSVVYVADYLEGRDYDVEYVPDPTAVPNELVGQ